MRLLNILLLTVLSGWLQNARAAEIIPLKTAAVTASSQQPLLTLVGKNSRSRLTLSDIERLPMYQTTLQTQWGMKGTFQGVLMRDLMTAYSFDRNAKRIVFRALDNYVSGLSRGEFDNSPAFLATRFNGHPIPPGERGPLILMWPAKAEAVLQGTAPLSSWIWSITEISTR
jgi:hypothetical protein